MRNEPIDFIGVDYDVEQSRRRGEDPAARPGAEDRRDGVLPLRQLRNELHGSRNSSRAPAPRPFRSGPPILTPKTWSQFFLKYVISHPAVTVVRTGTTKAAHMLDNIGGGIGRLPNEATRKRMAELVDALPRRSAATCRTARAATGDCAARRPCSIATSASTRRRPDSPQPSAVRGTSCS